MKSLEREVLEIVDGHVEVLGWITANNVTEMLDREHATWLMFATWISDEADVILKMTWTNVLLPELGWSHLAIAMEVAIIVGVLPVKVCWWNTKMNVEHSVSA